MEFRCRANMAHIRQSRPDLGLGFHAKVLEIFVAVPTSFRSGSGGREARVVDVGDSPST